MIQKSKRKYQKKPVTLEVHKTLSRKRYWAYRLVFCSLGALVGSIVGWILSAGLSMHWLILILGFLAGFFIPISSTLPWAFTWIRNQIGLSYEAALESQPDNYGFHQQLQERAKTQLRQLELPVIQAWWLPILVVAASLTLLPLIPKALQTFSNSNSSPSTPTPPTPNETVTPQDTPVTNQASTPTPPDEATPQQPTSEAQNLEGELAQSNSSASRDHQVADEEALSRFLEELQQQEQRGELDTNNINPELQPGQTTNNDNGENASRPRDEQSNPFENITEPQEGEAANEPGQTQSEQQQNQPGQQENQSESTQLTESQGPTQENSEPQPQENNAGGSETQGQEEGQQAMRDEGEGEGAGVLGSAPGETPSSLEGESEQAPELLAGQITQGPQNVAGTVRLPNTSDEVAPPSNTISPSFRPSDEEALTEGKIPLEYQNIIRNYFRY